jgi:predicted ABC-type ATPase
MPSLIVIGGPNGSGKTTLTSYLIQKGRIKTPVINPDDIALNELDGYDSRVKAAKISLIRRNEALSQHKDYAFETTFSGNSEINEVMAAKSAGYKLVLYYVALESVLDNVIRVEERRTNLGHHVEIEDIFRRHEKSKLNLLDYLHFFDKVYLFDNSESQRSRVAIFKNGKLLWLNKKHLEHPFYEDLFRS